MHDLSDMNDLNKPRKRLATTIKLDEAHIVEVEIFLNDYRARNPSLELTFSQAARYLILQGSAFVRYERAETERILAEMNIRKSAAEGVK